MAIIQTDKQTNKQEINANEDVNKREFLCTAGGNVKIGRTIMENNGKISQKLNTELPYEPAINF